jgi:hypothetical protein
MAYLMGSVSYGLKSSFGSSIIRLMKLKDLHIEAVSRYSGAQIGMVQMNRILIHIDPKK